MNQKGLSQAFVIILVALLTAGIVGGGVWYWQQKQVDKANQEKLDQESEFSKKLQEASKEETKTEDKTSTETKDETDDWKTGSIDGVTFKYPKSGWTLKTEKADSFSGPWFTLTKNKDGAVYSFAVDPGGRGGPAAEFLVGYTVKVVNNEIVLSNKKSSTEESDSAFFAKGVTAFMESFSNNGKNYSIIYEGAKDDSEDEIKIFELITGTIELAK